MFETCQKENKNGSKTLTEPIADQDVKNNTVPPALVEIWQHVTKSILKMRA